GGDSRAIRPPQCDKGGSPDFLCVHADSVVHSASGVTPENRVRSSRNGNAARTERVKTLACAASARDDARDLGHGHRRLWAMYAVSREARLRCFRGPSTK